VLSEALVSLNVNLNVGLAWRLLGTSDLGNPKDSDSYRYALALASGTGLNQADVIFHDRRTLAGSGNDDLDLRGALTNSIGGAAVFAKVKVILVVNRNVVAGDNLRIGLGSNPVASPWVASGDGAVIGPGGIFLTANPSLAGFATTADTADILRIANPGNNSIDFDLLLLGTSA